MAEHPNQALVRRGFEAFNNGDIATLSEIIADDAVQAMPGSHALSGEHKGRDNILTMYGKLAEMTNGTFKAELLDVYATDSTAVAVYRGSGERNGKKLDQRYALVFEILNGKAVRMVDVPEDVDAENDFLA